MTSACPGCAHEEACGHADVTHCANREPVEEGNMGCEDMMRETRPEPATWGWQTSSAATNGRWCSCDPLRKAEAARDRYRVKALRLACQVVSRGMNGCPMACAMHEQGSPEWCDAVLREVD